MITKFLTEKLDYDGSQLSGLFSYKMLRAGDNSLIAFIGAADVKEKLVDFEDKLNDDFIKAKLMLHFIFTHQGADLYRARLWQLLLVQKTFDALKPFVSNRPDIDGLDKEGDDIFVIKLNEYYKMSVSIATLSSCAKEMVHLAINISDEGAPVKTYSLNKLGIDPVILVHDIFDRFNKEYEGIKKSAYKVAGVA